MNYLTIPTLNKQQKEEVRNLWNKEYPVNLRLDSPEAFEHYLNGLTDIHHLLLINENGFIKGWFCDFIREKERWFAMILDSELHGQNLGSELLKQACTNHHELNGWVIDIQTFKKQNGQDYRSPLGFYLKNDFSIISEVRLETEKLSAVKIRWRK